MSTLSSACSACHRSRSVVPLKISLELILFALKILEMIYDEDDDNDAYGFDIYQYEIASKVWQFPFADIKSRYTMTMKRQGLKAFAVSFSKLLSLHQADIVSLVEKKVICHAALGESGVKSLGEYDVGSGYVPIEEDFARLRCLVEERAYCRHAG
ncbi:hypothetical protein TIFTF001_012077 [Ficus carica]|uniref:Uncharacterized protein n=1 Tax=Ficus carica TaxID=3494 RepID=A0AA88ABN3_FICCA|nr:hypothetical protein TIFTF001_012077 [Ficus carica]